MSVKVKYNNFKLKDGAHYQPTLDLLLRDISWGTNENEFFALNKLGLSDYKTNTPAIPCRTAVKENKCFDLILKDNHFNLQSEGIDHFVSTIAGDILLNPCIESIVVDDISFSGSLYSDFFHGPNVGADGVYQLLSKTINDVKRPILAYSVKPRMGLSVEEYAKIYKAAQKGGIDLIEDDERLIDPVYCPFTNRVKEMGALQKKGNTMFSANITGPVFNMIERLNLAKDAGIKFVKIDVMTTGFDALKYITDYIRKNMDGEIAVTCYPDAVGIYRHLSRKLVIKLTRLCGADIIYAGSPRWARIEGQADITKSYKTNMAEIADKYKMYEETLLSNKEIFQGKFASLPTMSNDCNISNIELIQKILLKEHDFYKFGVFVGGGISAFPTKLNLAVAEWINCMNYVGKSDVNNMENYKYKYLKEMEDAGIKTINLTKEIIGE